uniref:Uncharacterized protein n=1 Tax=Arundo donax TaxID=35708 RepID=A0A0A9ANA5_ARUDO
MHPSLHGWIYQIKARLLYKHTKICYSASRRVAFHHKLLRREHGARQTTDYGLQFSTG